jgi:hypothetical protein
MRSLKNLDVWSGGGWGVFIYPQPPNQPLGRLSVDGRTGHCLVRQPRHPTVRVLTVSTVGALTTWATGQSGAAPDRHCSLSGAPFGAALTLRELSAHCSHLQATVGVDRCAS